VGGRNRRARCLRFLLGSLAAEQEPRRRAKRQHHERRRGADQQDLFLVVVPAGRGVRRLLTRHAKVPSLWCPCLMSSNQHASKDALPLSGRET
jgi:hypothetical protein